RMLLSSSHVDLRHLPSFPTRRSSDLGGGQCHAAPSDLGRDRRHRRRQIVSSLPAIASCNDGGHKISNRFARFSTNKSQTNSRLADRKSTRLNSSHDQISYAVFCLKKK